MWRAQHTVAGSELRMRCHTEPTSGKRWMRVMRVRRADPSENTRALSTARGEPRMSGGYAAHSRQRRVDACAAL